MKKLTACLLLILCSTNCIDEMIINPYVFGLDTTPDGKQIFGIVGDSNADGRGSSIPIVASETLYNSDGSTLTEITTQSVANEGGGVYGSIWQQFATDYKALSGKKTVLVNGAIGGSEFYPNGDNNNWYTSGTLYAAWKTKMDNTLILLGLSRPKAIIMNLGLNDGRSSNTLADIITGIESLFSRLQTDFPNIPILIIQPGRAEAPNDYNDSDFYGIRNKLVEIAEANQHIHIVGNALTFVDVSGGYNADVFHYSQATNNTLGSQISRWYANSTITNKWARSIISTQFDDLSTTRKTLISNFITSQYNNGNYFKLEYLNVFKTTLEANFLIDWRLRSFAVRDGITSLANNYLGTGGTNISAFATGYINSRYTASGAGQNDFIVGCKLLTRNTASGTAAVLFSRFDSGGDGIRVAQSNTFLNYHANVLVASQRNGTDVALTSNTLYSVARNGGTEYLYKNKTLHDSHAIASSGATDMVIHIGRNYNNTTASFGLNGTYEYFFAAKFVGFDLDSFFDDMEYLIAHWND